MHRLAIGMALLPALAIIGIGAQYLAGPRAATRNFGLPLPEDGPNIAWWLRLKGVRDIVSGLLVLTFMAWSGSRAVGVILFVYSLIPIGDMLMILAAKGSTKHAFGIHGVTAALMILAAFPLTFGAP
jgi:Domain of unknown function (DUF4267)